jgi:hypothetical protein
VEFRHHREEVYHRHHREVVYHRHHREVVYHRRRQEVVYHRHHREVVYHRRRHLEAVQMNSCYQQFPRRPAKEKTAQLAQRRHPACQDRKTLPAPELNMPQDTVTKLWPEILGPPTPTNWVRPGR